MPKKSKEHVNKILESIRELRKQKVSERDIRHQLALIPRTWERYIKIIHEEDKKMWYDITRTQLENELFLLKASLEDTYKIANEIASSKEANNQDKLLACDSKDDARLSIVQLLTEGVESIKGLDKSVQEEDKDKTKMGIKSETTK